MASTNWTSVPGSAVAILNGISRGYPVPNGGDPFSYGFNSTTPTPSVSALYDSNALFNPSAKGGRISGAMQLDCPSLVPGAPAGFAAFLFFCMAGAGGSGPNVSNVAYMLGLSNANPSHIELRKGALQDGVPDVAPGTLGVLRQSTQTFDHQAFVHLQLEVAVNLNGDVVLSAWQSDLTRNPVGSPIWRSIAGLAPVTDDAALVNTGSAPLLLGYAGFGMQSAANAARTFFGQIQPVSQN